MVVALSMRRQALRTVVVPELELGRHISNFCSSTARKNMSVAEPGRRSWSHLHRLLRNESLIISIFLTIETNQNRYSMVFRCESRSVKVQGSSSQLFMWICQKMSSKTGDVGCFSATISGKMFRALQVSPNRGWAAELCWHWTHHLSPLDAEAS